jgi:hypothetical protein
VEDGNQGAKLGVAIPLVRIDPQPPSVDATSPSSAGGGVAKSPKNGRTSSSPSGLGRISAGLSGSFQNISIPGLLRRSGSRDSGVGANKSRPRFLRQPSKERPTSKDLDKEKKNVEGSQNSDDELYEAISAK